MHEWNGMVWYGMAWYEMNDDILKGRGRGEKMDGHGKQILKGNQKKLPSLCQLPPLSPTCSRYGKRHMISHPREKAPLLTSPVSLGGFSWAPLFFTHLPHIPSLSLSLSFHFISPFVFSLSFTINEPQLPLILKKYSQGFFWVLFFFILLLLLLFWIFFF
jgi:hypothetical protein